MMTASMKSKLHVNEKTKRIKGLSSLVEKQHGNMTSEA